MSHWTRWEGTSNSFRNQAVLVFLSPSLSDPLSSVQFVLGVAIGMVESERWLARTGCAELRGPFKMGDKQVRSFSLARNHPLQKESHSEDLRAVGMQLCFPLLSTKDKHSPIRGWGLPLLPAWAQLGQQALSCFPAAIKGYSHQVQQPLNHPRANSSHTP